MKLTKRLMVLTITTAVAFAPAAAFAQEDGGSDRPPRDAVVDVERDRPHDSLERLKKRALEQIAKSMAALGSLRSAIGGSPYITDGHAAQLLRDINAAADGLQELARKIEAATTLEELRPLIKAIPSFQIGNVLAPKTHQVIASDTLVAFGGKLERFSGKLENIIARLEEAGFEVGEAWRMLEKLNGQISEGVRLADPVAEHVIGLQPEDWPDPARSVLGKGKADLNAARASLRGAHGTAKAIVHFIRSLLDGTDVAVDAVATTTD